MRPKRSLHDSPKATKSDTTSYWYVICMVWCIEILSIDKFPLMIDKFIDTVFIDPILLY